MSEPSPPPPAFPLSARGHIAKRPKLRRRRRRAKTKRAPTYKKSQTAFAKLRRRNQREQPILPAKDAGCQHPKARARGCCQSRAITVVVDGVKVPAAFAIPAGYTPDIRHADQPQLPNPARLCTQHKFLVDAYAESQLTGDVTDLPVDAGGRGRPHDFAHRSQCPVCAKLVTDPRLEWVMTAWMKWRVSIRQAAAELGVTVNSFNHHAQYYDLDKKKNEREHTMLALQRAAEEGLAAGGHSVKTGIAAMRELSRQRGDVVNVDARVAVADLSSLSTAELAKRNADLAKRLAELEAGSK